ncbi:hypothetical protein KAU33_08545 [Candidatus Dependentiae bacterium]|nr:hypothetical protein [Candidatus Dependentiae bacterium]
MKGKLFLLVLVFSMLTGLVSADDFPFTLNEKFSYRIDVLYVDFETVQTERGDHMLTASDQKVKSLGSHNFMYYKAGTYKDAAGAEKPCYFFAFYYDVGRPTPVKQIEGILVIDENGEFIFLRYKETEIAGSWKFTERVEKKGKKIEASYIDESRSKPIVGQAITKADDVYYLDENFIFGFSIYLKMNNPFEKEKFSIKAIIPNTYITQKGLVISNSHDPYSLLAQAHELDKDYVFTKEDALTTSDRNTVYVSLELFDVEFKRKGSEIFVIEGESRGTRRFVSSKYGISLFVDKDGNLIRMNTEKRLFTLMEQRIQPKENIHPKSQK